MPYLSFDNFKSAIVIGAGHGIGQALCSELLNKNQEMIVHATYRNRNKANSLFDLQKQYPTQLFCHELDPTSEYEIQRFKNKLVITELNLLINCVGTLKDNVVSPERGLREINPKNLQHYFLVNSIVTPLLAKHFKDFFRGKHASCFCAISAKVGSIDDNKLGGWYGYRASKAALNMFLKNISIEFKRSAPKSVVLSIHPGTTKTELSKDFIQNSNLKIHSKEDTAKNIIEIIKNSDPKHTGEFVSWDHTTINW